MRKKKEEKLYEALRIEIKGEGQRWRVKVFEDGPSFGGMAENKSAPCEDILNRHFWCGPAQMHIRVHSTCRGLRWCRALEKCYCFTGLFIIKKRTYGLSVVEEFINSGCAYLSFSLSALLWP